MRNYVPLEDDSRRRGHSRSLKAFCVLSSIMNLAALWLFAMSNQTACNTFQDVPYLYSPAERAIRQKIVKFTRGVEDDIPIYERRPSAEVDEAWHQLYSGENFPFEIYQIIYQRIVAETKISKSDEMRMPNRTWPLGRYPGHYMTALDVFHQLHCLDTLRQQIHRGLRYNYTRVPISHARHCIGAIRQALMCSADISPIAWQWSEEHQTAQQRDDIVHVCRDFDQIRDWADRHTFVAQTTDFDVYVEDDSDVPLD